jgi:hypothetical protein
VHAYIGASPPCWAIFTEVIAREYSDIRYGGVHQLTVDAFAVQHPGRPERRAIQSVAVHLIGLRAAFESRADVGFGGEASAALKRAVAHKERFIWLAPPKATYQFTIVNVANAGGSAELHCEAVRRFALETWKAWSSHHDQVREWAEG